MPQPKQTKKKSLLREQMIRDIELPHPEEESRPEEGQEADMVPLPLPREEPKQGVTPMTIDVYASDRALLRQISQTLEARHGRSFSASQVIRWAVWHCNWDH